MNIRDDNGPGGDEHEEGKRVQLESQYRQGGRVRSERSRGRKRDRSEL